MDTTRPSSHDVQVLNETAQKHDCRLEYDFPRVTEQTFSASLYIFGRIFSADGTSEGTKLFSDCGPFHSKKEAKQTISKVGLDALMDQLRAEKDAEEARQIELAKSSVQMADPTQFTPWAESQDDPPRNWIGLLLEHHQARGLATAPTFEHHATYGSLVPAFTCKVTIDAGSPRSNLPAQVFETPGPGLQTKKLAKTAAARLAVLWLSERGLLAPCVAKTMGKTGRPLSSVELCVSHKRTKVLESASEGTGSALSNGDNRPHAVGDASSATNGTDAAPAALATTTISSANTTSELNTTPPVPADMTASTSQPQGSNSDSDSIATSSSPAPRTPTQVQLTQSLCTTLSLPQPTYAIQPTAPSTPNLFSGHAVFPANTFATSSSQASQADENAHPQVQGKIGEVTGVYGRKKAKEECARLTAEVLRGWAEARDRGFKTRLEVEKEKARARKGWMHGLVPREKTGESDVAAMDGKENLRVRGEV
ncbi:MAG: hypothetical protein M1828_004833 [Chrysothrix sp. TS-e1954]|nr:MAG: hypothetical protein M1828_004833 [Chrysothrix sp. TS-e1954]